MTLTDSVLVAVAALPTWVLLNGAARLLTRPARWRRSQRHAAREARP